MSAAKAVAAGVAMQVIPPVVGVLVAVALGVGSLPRWSSSVVAFLLAAAAISWCLWASALWQRWVESRKVDRPAAERLGLAIGLLWRKR